MGLFFNEETTVETIVTTTTQVHTTRRANWLGIIAALSFLLLVLKAMDRHQLSPQPAPVGVQNNGGVIIIENQTINVEEP